MQMLALTHQIAGVTFRTESDINISFLARPSFQKFLVENKTAEIVRRYHGISPESLSLPPYSQEQTKRLMPCVPAPSWNTNSSVLLRSPIVCDFIEARLKHPESVSMELAPSFITIYDFAECELDVFYLKLSEHEKFLAEARVDPIGVATFLIPFSAIMIHSSGLIMNGRTAVFLAPDEGGKTTVVKQANIGTVLCDDQVVLRKQGNVFMAHGSPWGLIADATSSAKIGGFFLLEQAEQFELLPIKPVVVFEYLWNEHMSRRFFLPKYLRLQAFNLFYETCHQVPCYRMRFPKQYVDWDAIDSAMN